MKKITNKEYEEFRQYRLDKLQGRILTPDGLQFICSANHYDYERIGRDIVETLNRMNAK